MYLIVYLQQAAPMDMMVIVVVLVLVIVVVLVMVMVVVLVMVVAVVVMVIDYHYTVRMFFCRHQLVLALYGIVWPVWSCKGESHLCKAHWVIVPHLLI